MRLADSLPASVVEEWVLERTNILRRAEAMGRALSQPERDRLDVLHAKRIEEYLDRGAGVCWMRDARIADLVEGALLYFDRVRYDMMAWCVMPNHVHVVFSPLGNYGLSSILHSWKSYTSTSANRLLDRTGTFWQSESYDHLVRGPEDLANQVRYVLSNPRAAGLSDWKWVGCRAPQPSSGP
jgi:hypothetical protein